MTKKAGIYIHIPFCVKRCNYCDFTSYIEINLIPLYISALKKEIELKKNEGRNLTFDSIYFGGGTPSLLKDLYLSSILDTLYKFYKISKNVEITIEANPESITLSKLKSYKNLNIKRLSIGVQSFDDKVLKGIGRIHDTDRAIKAIEFARKTSFNNLNIDLIVGLPYSDITTFNSNITYIKKFKPEHISLYILMIEKRAKLSKEIKKGLIQLPDDNSIEYYWNKYIEFLKGEGYIHYEISNFALKGFACRHNLHYWMRDPYIGMGVSASSFLNAERSTNTKNIKIYINRLNKGTNPTVFREKILDDKNRVEEIMLGLRLIDRGINKELIPNEKENLVRKFIDLKLLKDNKGKLCLTEKGVFLSNQVIASFI